MATMRSIGFPQDILDAARINNAGYRVGIKSFRKRDSVRNGISIRREQDLREISPGMGTPAEQDRWEAKQAR